MNSPSNFGPKERRYFLFWLVVCIVGLCARLLWDAVFG